LQAGSIDPSAFPPFGRVIGFVLFFVVVWCTVCVLVSSLAGWFALARRFKKQSEPSGEIRTAGPFFYAVYMRFWGQYSSVLRLTAASDALYVSIMFLFRIGHPPLRIPWEEIRFGRTKFFFRTYLMLTLGSEEKIPMRISLRMARNLGILDRCPE
jgi:hypothetical protein